MRRGDDSPHKAQSSVPRPIPDFGKEPDLQRNDAGEIGTLVTMTNRLYFAVDNFIIDTSRPKEDPPLLDHTFRYQYVLEQMEKAHDETHKPDPRYKTQYFDPDTENRLLVDYIVWGYGAHGSGKD